jgi:hypothetical protein
MPDLLMNTGSYIDDISKNGLNGEKAKQLFNELGARQLDLWTKKTLIRPFERSLVQKIGFIDDLQFNYNLNYYGQEEKLLGIVMAKNITDRVILRTVTNMDARFSGGPTKVTEVEILYYLLRNLSVNFANVRDYQENDFHPKFSIKGSYEF